MFRVTRQGFLASAGVALVVLAAPMVVYAADPLPGVLAVGEVVATLGGAFLFMVAVSAAIEKIVTHFQWLVDLLPGESPKDYVLGILGIGLSLAMGIGVFGQLAGLLEWTPGNPTLFYWADLVLTGLLMGSGAQVVHAWLGGLGIGKDGEDGPEARSLTGTRWP